MHKFTMVIWVYNFFPACKKEVKKSVKCERILTKSYKKIRLDCEKRWFARGRRGDGEVGSM